MDLCPRYLLVLASLPVLCLGQTIHTQEGLLPKPSIWARPGPVIPRGQPVTIVCQSPARADLFCLMEEKNTFVYWDQRIDSRQGSQWEEARFHIHAMSEVMARSCFCQYLKGLIWSNRSEMLELKVTDKDVSTAPSVPGTSPEVTALPPSTHSTNL